MSERGVERATDKLSGKQCEAGRVVKLYLQHKQSCRQGSSSDADGSASANDKHEAEHNDKHEADERATHTVTQ